MISLTQSLIKVRCCINPSKNLRTLNNACQRASYSEEAAESTDFFTDSSNVLDDEKLASLQNISGLREADRRKLHGLAPYDKPIDNHHHTLRWNRKQVGLYGLNCGYDPALCFTTKEEMEDLIEYERVAFDRPLMEVRNEALQKIAKEKEERILREKRVEENLRKNMEWKREILERVNVKAKEVSEAQKKRERLLEEVRRFFGYTIDVNDEKFQYMLEFKEKEQQKLDKLEKKKKREQILMQKLAALGATSGNSDQSSPQTEKNDENTEKNMK